MMKLADVVTKTRALGQALQQAVGRGQTVQLRNAYLSAQKTDYDSDLRIEAATDGFVDLGDFAGQLPLAYSADMAIRTSAQELQIALSTAVITRSFATGTPWILNDELPRPTWNLTRTSGLSIFLPLGEDLVQLVQDGPDDPAPISVRVRDIYNASQLQFVAETGWKTLIDAYYLRPPSPIPSTTLTQELEGLQLPDITPPRTAIRVESVIQDTRSPSLTIPLTLTLTLNWTSEDVHSGVQSAFFARQRADGTWEEIRSLGQVIGSEFTHTLLLEQTACVVRVAVFARDEAGNLETVRPGVNEVTLVIPYCVYLPVVLKNR
jgi:hypothetical protein